MEDIDKLMDDISEDEKIEFELTNEQLATVCVSLQSDIEDYREVRDNYGKLEEYEEPEISKEEINQMITSRKIIIERLTNSHYPIFEWVFCD